MRYTLNIECAWNISFHLGASWPFETHSSCLMILELYMLTAKLGLGVCIFFWCFISVLNFTPILQDKLFSSENRTEISVGKKLKNDMLPEIEKVHKVLSYIPMIYFYFFSSHFDLLDFIHNNHWTKLNPTNPVWSSFFSLEELLSLWCYVR